MNKIKKEIPELKSMKSYPKELFYSGNLKLLNSKKISIVGSRKPTKYSRMITQNLASTLSKKGFCIVSGGAMGIDAIAHNAATSKNTISVLPCGIDIKYPQVNKKLLEDIEKNGLLISQFEPSHKPRPWSFVVRNELVVALGDILIVTEAAIDSGTMRSVEFALKMQKDIYVIPQRVGESDGTNNLLEENKAKCIYNIDNFIKNVLGIDEINNNAENDFIKFCKTNPSYEIALKKFPTTIFEAELNGEIEIKNGKIYLL